jgi:hypothetical protein
LIAEDLKGPLMSVSLIDIPNLECGVAYAGWPPYWEWLDLDEIARIGGPIADVVRLQREPARFIEEHGSERSSVENS